MIPRYRAWFGSEMYDKPVVYDGEFYLDWRDFENGETYDGAILMQSTGLFDVNGKEIFEGDIVVNKYGNVGYVAYLQQEAGFVVVLKKSDYRLGHRNTGESYDVATNHEIIGNIYQNPESVEG
ncbi:YopX family protein [Streptococcus suis]|uniref:YopX family protein n=1 Tax=Streptococcus suis TaxID=1307 RepID=UPI000CF43AF2|nr:YopX family protein [Streptococcus suis]